MKLRASLLATGVVPLARAAAGLHSTSEPPHAGRRKHREHLREAPAVYTQLSCKLRAQDNFGDHCLLNSPLPGLQAIHPSHAAELTGDREKENAKAAHLLCKRAILHIPEEANNWFCCRNRMGFQRKRGVTHMTAISFLRMLNLVTKLALPGESLMSATEGQGERSAALSLGH